MASAITCLFTKFFASSCLQEKEGVENGPEMYYDDGIYSQPNSPCEDEGQGEEILEPRRISPLANVYKYI